MNLKTAWQETCKFIRMMQKSESMGDRLSDPDRCDYGGRALSADLLLRSDLKLPHRRSVSAGDAERLLDDQFQRYSGVEQ